MFVCLDSCSIHNRSHKNMICFHLLAISDRCFNWIEVVVEFRLLESDPCGLCACMCENETIQTTKL